MPGTVFDEEDTTFTPLSLINYAKRLFIILGLVLVNAILLVVIAYIGACYWDNRPPSQIYEYKADDTYVGGKVHVYLAGYRLRSCEIQLYRWATDINGNVIFEGTVDRPINGEINKPLKLNDNFQLNNKAVAGQGKMYQLFRWRCPYNVLHKYVQPLELTIEDPFYIYATKEDYDRAMVENKEKSDKEQENKERKELEQRKD